MTALLAVTGCATDGADGDETLATPQDSPTGEPTPRASASSPGHSPEPAPSSTATPSEPPTAPRTDPPTGKPAEGPPDTSLTIVVDTGSAEGAVEWTLRCDPPGGTHPDPAAACATLAEVDPAVFDPVPPDQACTQIFGGPETATVTGELRGERLDAEFARNNGCEINRWDALAGVFP